MPFLNEFQNVSYLFLFLNLNLPKKFSENDPKVLAVYRQTLDKTALFTMK